MAIGFRSVGARTKADVSASGSPQSFGMPLGHVSTDYLLWVILTDDNTGPAATPSGWTYLGGFAPGSSTSSPYAGRPHLNLFGRFDDGSLGSSQSMTFNTNSWPGGDPYVLGFIAAYTGVDQSAPVEIVNGTSTLSTAAALAHPTVTTVAPNDWLLSIRGVVSDNVNLTFTNSVGTDVARVNEGMTNPSSPSLALYDSNAALTAGAQTQRTTTASNTVTYGSVGVSLALKAANTAGTAVAIAGVARMALSASGATASAASGPWDLCSTGGLPTYSFAIDWNDDGNFTSSALMMLLGLSGTGGVDEATNDIISDISIAYGRDQNRQLNPAAVGSASFSLINVARKYSPEWSSSVFFGNLEPARPMRGQVTWGGQTFPLFRGRIDDYNVKADMSDRSVDLTFLDALNDLSRITLSTGVYQSMRTGELINAILDEVGWSAGRQIDLGATIVKYWWAEQQSAYDAITDLIKSEGAPAVAFVAPDGTFVFHDRHHRIQNSSSTTSQATFAQAKVFDCTEPVDPPGLDFTAPFAYAHGWRDIVNSVTFDVTERLADDNLSVVWSTEDTITLTNGQTTVVEISTTDPFIDAVSPVLGTDYTFTGTGTPVIMMNRDSGTSLKISIYANGGAVSVNNLQVQARSIPVQRNLKVHREEPGSIGKHGERSYPDQAPWANANDADAIAGAILLRYAERRPTVDLRVVTKDPQHFLQIVSRTIGDRIHIRNDEMGIDDDFFVERITHTIQRINQAGHPPVHAVVFGCEKATVNSANPFRFDVRGAGFDQGIFDPTNSDSPTTVFQFDHPTNGQFDYGVYGT